MLGFSKFRIIIAIALLVLVIFDVFTGISIWWYVGLIFLYIFTVLFYSWYFRGNFFLKAIHQNLETNQNHIAITFDDGPHPEFTSKVLDLLKNYNQKATFFLIGKNAVNNLEIVKRVVAEGHVIGNHSYSHSRNMGFFSAKKIASELQQTTNLLLKQTSKQTNLFRPPFGVTNPNIASALEATGMRCIGWNIRSLDTMKISEEKVYLRITKNLKAGDVILLHDTSEKTVRVLERLLVYIQKEKLESVTIDELFNINAYA